MQTLGDRIRDLREAKNWTPFDLAIATRIPEQNIRLWEKGRAISEPANIAAIADALDTTTDFLIKGVPSVLEAAV